MKRIVCLLLAIVFVFMVTACKKEKSRDVSSSNSQSVSSKGNIKEKFDGEKDFLDIVVGEWVYSAQYKGNSGIKLIELSDDYSYDIDGKNGKWGFLNTPPESIDKFDIYYENGDGTQQFFTIQKYDKNVKNSHYILRVGGSGDSFINSKKFEVVEISLSNYQEYFEYQDYFFADKDKFGDYTGGIIFEKRLTLKDGYKINDKLSYVEYKYSHTINVYGLSFDKTSGAYQKLDVVYKYDDVYNTNDVCYYREDGKFSGTVGGSNAYEVQPGMGITNYEYLAEYPENINITGILGKLYICKL